MDRESVELSDAQWARINEEIGKTGQAMRDEGDGPINDIRMIFDWTPIGRAVELWISGRKVVIEDIWD